MAKILLKIGEGNGLVRSRVGLHQKAISGRIKSRQLNYARRKHGGKKSRKKRNRLHMRRGRPLEKGKIEEEAKPLRGGDRWWG